MRYPAGQGPAAIPTRPSTEERSRCPSSIPESMPMRQTLRATWHSVPNWPDHVTGDEMLAAMDEVGVDGAIFISAFSLYHPGS